MREKDKERERIMHEASLISQRSEGRRRSKKGNEREIRRGDIEGELRYE